MQSPTAFAERVDRNAIETGNAFAPKFGDDGLIPVVTQDSTSGEVLMVAYMNQEALRRTITERQAIYYSRSRRQLWHKGETSGHVQKVTEMRTDCDQDVILLKVDQVGPGCCHAGYASCFYRRAPLGEDFTATADNGIAQLEFSEEKAYNPDEVY